MPTSEATITVNAPQEAVFDAIADQEKAAHYYPASEVVVVDGKPGEPGSSAEYVYRVAGMRIRGRGTVIEVDKPRKLVQEFSGAMPGIFTWSLLEQNQAVQVTFRVDYRVPFGILGTILDKLFLGRMNQRNAESTLKGLKAYCEA